MRELEQKLGELEGRHTDLTRSYESLQVEYSSIKAELDRLRKDSSKTDDTSRQSFMPSSDTTWDHSKDGGLDPLLFDVSAFCYDHEDDDDDRKL